MGLCQKANRHILDPSSQLKLFPILKYDQCNDFSNEILQKWCGKIKNHPKIISGFSFDSINFFGFKIFLLL